MHVVHNRHRCLADRQPWARAATLALGACGVIGQVLLWRELLALYQGNELTTGIILANWLLAEAAGAAIFGRRANRHADIVRLFAGISLAYASAVLCCWIATRLLRPALGIAIGQPVGTTFVLVTSLGLLAPASFLHGALFPIAGRLCAMSRRGSETESVAALYVWESFGTLLGALSTKLALAAGSPPVAFVAAIWGLTGGVLITGPSTSPQVRRSTLLPQGLVALGLGLLLAATAKPLHRWLLHGQFHPYPVLDDAISPLANWAVLSSGGQYVLAADGQPVLLCPEPDRLGVQTLAHLPMLAHPAPRRLAVLSGGLGGLLEEILKHPCIERLDYVESDPAFLRLYRKFSPEIARRELDDPRVRLLIGDGRRRLRQLEDGVDILWIGVDEPTTLQRNRYFTVEFFHDVRRRLAPGGLLVLALPAHPALATPEQRRLHACVADSLRRVLTHVRVLPGDDRILYLASADRDLSGWTAEEAQQRLHERGLQAEVPLIWPLVQRLHPGWTEWFQREYQVESVAPNHDLHPRATFHALADRQAVHEPRLAAALDAFRQHPRWTGVVAGVVLVSAVVAATLRARRRRRRAPLLIQVATTGMAGMMWDLLVIVTFQSSVGHVQTWIGLLMATYMLGAAIAAAYMGAWSARTRSLRLTLWLCEALLIVAVVALPAGLSAAAQLASSVPAGAIALFLVLNFLGGVFTGALFPCAGAWRVVHGEQLERAAGVLQAADLAGGWTAGLLGPVLVLPLAGVAGTCSLVAVVKFLSLLQVGYMLLREPAPG